MPRRVLIPVDGSSRSFEAIEYGCVLFPDAEISILHVIDPARETHEGPGDTERWETRVERDAESMLRRAAQRAEEQGVDPETIIEWGRPYRSILNRIEQVGADHVVLGSTGRSTTGQLFLGSVSEAVLQRSSVPVTVVRFPAETPTASRAPERVLAPVDGSKEGDEGLKFALEQFPDADVTALTVGELDVDIAHDELTGTYLESAVEEAREDAEGVLTRAEDLASEHGISIRTEIAFGNPAAAIVEYADEQDVEHVVVGSRGRSGISRLLLGSVAETVAKRTPVPVTVVR